MTVKCSLSLLSLLLLTSASNAMQRSAKDGFHKLAISAAMLALRMKRDTRDIRALARIDSKDIKSVTRFENEIVESYFAELSGGDELSADKFLSGDLKGEVYSTRIIDMSVMLPVDNKYFSILKNLYEKQRQLVLYKNDTSCSSK